MTMTMAIPEEIETNPTDLTAFDVKNMKLAIQRKFALQNNSTKTTPLSSQYKQTKAGRIKKKPLHKKNVTSPTEQRASKQKKLIQIKDKSSQKKATSPTKQEVETSKQKKLIQIKDKSSQKKATSPTQQELLDNLPLRACRDILRGSIVSYDPKTAAAAQPPDSKAKSAAIERANEVQASLPSELPSFVKAMLPSHVAGGFWLGLTKQFCDANLPKHDKMIVLVDEEGQEFETRFLVGKIGLSGGWRGFAIAHKLLEGDVLVFQLTEHWKFKVYIVRVHGLGELDGALGLLNLIPSGMNVTNVYQRKKKNSADKQKAVDMDIDSHQENVQENDLVVYDQSADDGECADAPVSEGIRFSESAIEFKSIKGIDDFNIVVDTLVIDSEIPKHFLIKYYDLCRSQMTYLHENLLKGLNVKLAVGIILEIVTISDAIRACNVTITRDDIETWDKTLKSFEEIGMKVGFLRARISKLKGLLFESNELLAAKRKEQAKAEEEMKLMKEKLNGVRGVIKNLDVEIGTLKLKGQKLDTIFHKEANAPW